MRALPPATEKEAHMLQQHSSKAMYYKRRAQTCGTLADWARSSADRARLMQMRASCLSLAAKEDWLDGLPPVPPASARALTLP
jgi:hypothetical protein